MVSERFTAEERFLFFLTPFSCPTRALGGFEMKGKIPQWFPEEAGLPQSPEPREVTSFAKCKSRWCVVLTGDSLWPSPASVMGVLRAQHNWGCFC